MRTLKIGDVTITSIIERDGPWRRPEDMFPAYDPDVGRRHLAELDPVVFDPASGRMVIPYQTFVVRTPSTPSWSTPAPAKTRAIRRHSISPSSPGSTASPPPVCGSTTSTTCFAPTCTSTIAAGTPCCATAAGCRPSRRRNTCSTNANTPLGRSRPNAARTARRRRQCVAVQLRAGGGGRPGAAGRRRLCARRYDVADADAGPFAVPLLRQYPLGGQHAVVIGDLMHHALQCREPDWSTIFDWDPQQAARSRRRSWARSPAPASFVLPIHFPHPTAGLVEADGERFRYSFIR